MVAHQSELVREDIGVPADLPAPEWDEEALPVLR
jgi:hypothetical protein